MRARRSVTAQPIGIPSRSLKPAIELRALRTVGRWPVICARSRTAASTRPLFSTAPLTPMFTTILLRRGTALSFSILKCSFKRGFTSLSYLSLRRAMSSRFVACWGVLGRAGRARVVRRPVLLGLGRLRGPLLLGLGLGPAPRALAGLRVEVHDVTDVDRRLALHALALGILLRRLLVSPAQVD